MQLPTKILHSDSLNKMIMNLPKPTPRIQALQAKLNNLKKTNNKSLSFKTKPKNLQCIDRDLEEDIFNSTDFFSED
jgi:hypothetical protein